MVAPTLQIAAYAQTPVHADPTVRLSGRVFQPLEHRGELSVQPSSPFRASVIELANIQIAPPPRIALGPGENAVLPGDGIDYQVGMPASAWALRRNYRPTPAIQPGEAEV